MDVASITALAEAQLVAATTARAVAARSPLRRQVRSASAQTIVALGGGRVMGEHKSPGDASVFCLRGRVLLRAGQSHAELGQGDLVAVPPQRHDLEALEPSVLLLTVALH